MYYPSYEDYMRDLFYYNGLSNPNNAYSYMNMQNRGIGGQSLSNYNNQNLNDYYPSIYKIVNPVVQRVVSGNNYQFVNEETINNIVDVVIGITTGDLENLDSSQRSEKRRQCGNSYSNSNNNSCNNSNGTVSCNNSSGSSGSINNNSSNSNSMTNNLYQENGLLRDLIRILTIKEILNRNNIRRFPNAFGNNIVPQSYYMNSPYMMY